MRPKNTVNVLVAVNVLAMAIIVAALVSGSGPVAYAQNEPVDLASQQRAQIIAELRGLNARLDGQSAQQAKAAEESGKREQTQIDLLRDLQRAITEAAAGEAARAADRHDELLAEFDTLDKSMADAVDALKKMGADATARREQDLKAAIDREKGMHEYLESGKVKVVVLEEKAAPAEKK
jgi:hypothetical protein